MNNKIVQKVMTSPAIVCEESQTIKEAIEIMKKHNIGFLPITKNNIIVGVVTDRDILLRAIGNYELTDRIGKIMSGGEIHFTSPSTSLIDAAKIMSENKIRRLVVLNNGSVVGVLTTKNLLEEKELIPYIQNTYIENKTLNEYSMYANSNPHDSVKAADYPL